MQARELLYAMLILTLYHAFHKLQGGDVLKRNENDAAALQAKVAAKKAAQEQASSATPAKAPVERKKVPMAKDPALDDLLSAGLSGAKAKRVK
jgi:hypothetical protein